MDLETQVADQRVLQNGAEVDLHTTVTVARTRVWSASTRSIIVDGLVSRSRCHRKARRPKCQQQRLRSGIWLLALAGGFLV
jgi:hypothetical protein